jgi:hypothetical protein
MTSVNTRLPSSSQLATVAAEQLPAAPHCTAAVLLLVCTSSTHLLSRCSSVLATAVTALKSAVWPAELAAHSALTVTSHSLRLPGKAYTV